MPDDQIKNFTDLMVWQKAHSLFLILVNNLKELKNSNAARIIINQILRSSSSISANIAEGFNAHSTKEYIKYLDIAKRTTGETENWLYKIRDLRMLENEISGKLVTNCKEIS